ncbi:hypothetical protein [Persephonella sp.]
MKGKPPHKDDYWLEVAYNNSTLENTFVQDIKKTKFRYLLPYFSGSRVEFFGGYWFVIMSKEQLEEFIKFNKCFFYQDGDVKIKIVDENTDIIKTALVLKRMEVEF